MGLFKATPTLCYRLLLNYLSTTLPVGLFLLWIIIIITFTHFIFYEYVHVMEILKKNHPSCIHISGHVLIGI